MKSKQSKLQKRVKSLLRWITILSAIAALLSIYSSEIVNLIINLIIVFFAVGCRADYRFTKWHKWLRPLHIFWIILALAVIGLIYTIIFPTLEFFIYLIEIFVILTMLGAISKSNEENPDICEFC